MPGKDRRGIVVFLGYGMDCSVNNKLQNYKL